MNKTLPDESDKVSIHHPQSPRRKDAETHRGSVRRGHLAGAGAGVGVLASAGATTAGTSAFTGSTFGASSPQPTMRAGEERVRPRTKLVQIFFVMLSPQKSECESRGGRRGQVPGIPPRLIPRRRGPDGDESYRGSTWFATRQVIPTDPTR